MKSRKQAVRLSVLTVLVGAAGASLVTYSTASIAFAVFCWLVVVTLAVVMTSFVNRTSVSKGKK